MPLNQGYGTYCFWLMKMRERELRRDAKRYRQLKLARANRPTLGQRFLLRLGDLLIALGTWLLRRYAPLGYRAHDYEVQWRQANGKA